MRPMAAELARLRVKAVSPGVVDTPVVGLLAPGGPNCLLHPYRGAPPGWPYRTAGRHRSGRDAPGQQRLRQRALLVVDGGAHLAR